MQSKDRRMTTYSEFTLAAIQAAPVYFDRDASTEKACVLIDQAAGQGATLAAFGETWLPGYPFFTGKMHSPLWAKAAAEYIENAVEIPSPTTDKLCDAARRSGIDVVIGVVERDSNTRGTAYCTLLFIGKEGVILGRHRKLKPTAAERIMWGEGDAAGLRVHEREYARISGLNCWEHNMVLPGYALMAGGTQIHIGAWPGGLGSRQLFLSQAFASQGACYVIMVGGLGQAEHIPERYRELAGDWAGDSAIIDPWGNVIAGPVQGETILTAKGSLETVYNAKAICDVAGHYSRPDVLQLHLNRRSTARLVVHEHDPQAVNGARDQLAPDPAGNLTEEEPLAAS
jgi:nitrilase